MKPKMRISIQQQVNTSMRNPHQIDTPYNTLHSPDFQFENNQHYLESEYSDTNNIKIHVNSKQLDAQYKNDDYKENQSERYMSSNQHQRITFQKNTYPERYRTGKKYNKQKFQSGLSVSSRGYQSKTKLESPVQEMNELASGLKQKQEQINILSQAFEDLEEHNKHIIEETKERVEDYENYIERLLGQNNQLESKLLEYEGQIEELQNILSEEIEKQKSRQIQIQKILSESIAISKQNKMLKLQIEEQSKMSVNTYQLTKANNRIEDLQHENKSLSEMITLLQQSLTEKQVVIKKMSQFNNQMCLQIIQLKKEGMRSYAQDMKKSYISIQTNEKQKKKDGEYAKKIKKLGKQNMQLKSEKEYLQEEVKQLTYDHTVTIIKVEQLSKTIWEMKKRMNRVVDGIESFGLDNQNRRILAISQNNQHRNLRNKSFENNLYMEASFNGDPKLAQFSDIKKKQIEDSMKSLSEQIIQTDMQILEKINKVLRSLLKRVEVLGRSNEKINDRIEQIKETLQGYVDRMSIDQKNKSFSNHRTQSKNFSLFEDNNELKIDSFELVREIKERSQVNRKVKKLGSLMEREQDKQEQREGKRDRKNEYTTSRLWKMENTKSYEKLMTKNSQSIELGRKEEKVAGEMD